ncbi:hypothetical protein HK104_010354 [Borealophlyctis nickersoniae]|nr:hypothetical protein HK104_010354 [Borealophlyctis nickersoniae]
MERRQHYQHPQLRDFQQELTRSAEGCPPAHTAGELDTADALSQRVKDLVVITIQDEKNAALLPTVEYIGDDGFLNLMAMTISDLVGGQDQIDVLSVEDKIADIVFEYCFRMRKL